MLSIMSLRARGFPDISRPTSKPSFIPSSAWTSGSFSRETSTPRVAPILSASARRSRVHVGDDDLSGAAVARDRRGHAADRAGPGDEDVLADEVELEGGVGGVAEGVEAGEDVQRDRGVHGHGVGRRDAEELGEGPGPVDADALRVLAEVPAAGQAVAADPADDVALAVDQVALLEALDGGAHLLDDADELVADHHGRLDRLLGPVVPVVDVDVGAADGGLLDPDQDVVRRPGRAREPRSARGRRPGLTLDSAFIVRGLMGVSQTVAPKAPQNNPEPSH